MGFLPGFIGGSAGGLNDAWKDQEAQLEQDATRSFKERMLQERHKLRQDDMQERSKLDQESHQQQLESDQQFAVDHYDQNLDMKLDAQRQAGEVDNQIAAERLRNKEKVESNFNKAHATGPHYNYQDLDDGTVLETDTQTGKRNYIAKPGGKPSSGKPLTMLQTLNEVQEVRNDPEYQDLSANLKMAAKAAADDPDKSKEFADAYQAMHQYTSKQAAIADASGAHDLAGKIRSAYGDNAKSSSQFTPPASDQVKPKPPKKVKSKAEIAAERSKNRADQMIVSLNGTERFGLLKNYDRRNMSLSDISKWAQESAALEKPMHNNKSISRVREQLKDIAGIRRDLNGADFTRWATDALNVAKKAGDQQTVQIIESQLRNVPK